MGKITLSIITLAAETQPSGPQAIIMSSSVIAIVVVLVYALVRQT